MPRAECILSKDLSKKTQNFHLWLISSPGKKRANESEGRILNGQASIEGLSQHWANVQTVTGRIFFF